MGQLLRSRFPTHYFGDRSRACILSPRQPQPRALGCAVLAVASLLVTLNSRPAFAQSSPYSVTVYNEGPGFRLGSAPLTIHPGLAADLGYDSNVFYLPSNPIGAGVFRLRAHIDLATLPPQSFENDHSSVDPRVDFRFSAQYEHREYISNNPSVLAQRSDIFSASADLSILPKGPFTLRISDVYLRTVDPRNEESPANFSRNFNRAAVLASYRWSRFEIGVGDYFQINFWENADLHFGNNMADEGQVYARYKILSQTLLSVVARVGWVHYLDNSSIDSIPVRVLAGASTLFTTWFGASANIGYGNSLSQTGKSFNSVIANADLRFLLPHGLRITLGYDRDFYDSIFATQFTDDRLFLVFDMPLISHLTAHLDGGVRFREYGTLVPATLVGGTGAIYTTDNGTPTSDRNDRIYDAHFELTARATSWLAISANYNFVADDTNFAIGHSDPALSTTGSPVRYMKHSVFLRVDVAY